MKFPAIIPLESFSDNPANNYLQWLFRFSVRDGTTDILFYIGKENIQVYRNHPLVPTVEIPFSQLPKEVIDFANAMSVGIEKINAPEGFAQGMPLPSKIKKGLEKRFKDIYRLNSLDELSCYSPLMAIKVDEVTLLTRLSKISDQDRTGYRIHLSY